VFAQPGQAVFSQGAVGRVGAEIKKGEIGIGKEGHGLGVGQGFDPQQAAQRQRKEIGRRLGRQGEEALPL